MLTGSALGGGVSLFSIFLSSFLRQAPRLFLYPAFRDVHDENDHAGNRSDVSIRAPRGAANPQKGTFQPVNFTLFSLAEPQSVRKSAMLSRAAGISGLMSKPPGGFVSARMNSRQGQRHRDTERQADAKTNQSGKNGLAINVRKQG
jgi:hypothetical protein